VQVVNLHRRLGAAHARRRTLATAMRLSRRRRRPGVGSDLRSPGAARLPGTGSLEPQGRARIKCEP